MNTQIKRIKTILSKKQQSEFLDNNWTVKTLHFKWGKTGMHKCTLLDRNNNTLGSAGGCGYDKKGTAFGEFITTHFNREIKKLNSSDYYGLTHYNNKTNKRQKRSSKNTKSYLDGACGFNCMENILNRIGFVLEFVKDDKWNTYYMLSELPKGHHSRKKYIYK